MEIVGSVARNEVPEGQKRFRPPGVWTQLAQRAVDDHKNERVTVLRLKDDKELKRLRANVQIPLKKLGYRSRMVVIEQKDEIRVFLELALRDDAATAPPGTNNSRPVAEAWSAR